MGPEMGRLGSRTHALAQAAHTSGKSERPEAVAAGASTAASVAGEFSQLRAVIRAHSATATPVGLGRMPHGTLAVEVAPAALASTAPMRFVVTVVRATRVT